MHSLQGQALQRLGYASGDNILFESRYAYGKSERLPALAEELVRAEVDVIVVFGNVAASAAKAATSRIPIVIWGSSGGAESGLTASVARPGGNMTGVGAAPDADARRRLELLRQLLPHLAHLTLLGNPADPGFAVSLKHLRAAASGVGVDALEIRRPEEADSVFAEIMRRPPDALLVFTDDLTWTLREQLGAFTREHCVPTLCTTRSMAEAGCMASYGLDAFEISEIVARQVDKLLKGAQPGDLPFEPMTSYELTLNQPVARAIGVTIPPAVQSLATAVIGGETKLHRVGWLAPFNAMETICCPRPCCCSAGVRAT